MKPQSTGKQYFAAFSVFIKITNSGYSTYFI